MYPIVRMIKEFVIHRNAPKLAPLGVHVSHHRCWPQDIDVFMEMNNGRILTIMDLGRTVLGKRVGLLDALSKNKWSLTMAGVSVRYRKRITPFTKFRLVSRAVTWDSRFVYLDQSIWIGDTCAAQALYRSAVTERNKLIEPDKVFRAMGYEGDPPLAPEWVKNWIDAEGTRPWPPEVSEE